MKPSEFWKPEFLRQHIRHTLDFYAPRALDETGGFFHFFKDDGEVYERSTRHLVSSTRFVFNHAMAFREFGDPVDQARAAHGLRYLREAHQQPNGGYAWLLHHERRDVLDTTNHCYGLAFVLLAHAHAAMAGVKEARAGIAETFELMEQRFWQAEHGLYADEADAHWRLSPYRGQNANMHSCEALLAAYEATREQRYLRRAALLAQNIAVRQAGRCGGLIWEHYDADWQPDWDYNRHDPANLFRPWGYQVGHLTEWAKLLLILRRFQNASWLLPRAIELFDAAWARGWDAEHGGLVYGFVDGGRTGAGPLPSPASPLGGQEVQPTWGPIVCDGDKYFWVQAESFAAAALLYKASGEPRFKAAYEQLWAYSWQHFVDHQHGAWFRILGPDNRKLSDAKSPAGKTDYHTMGACHEVLLALRG